MIHLKLYEDINKYTLKEVYLKLLGSNNKQNKIITKLPSEIKDKILKYLIKQYISYIHNVEIEDVKLSAFGSSNKRNILITYINMEKRDNKWVEIENLEEFIQFINNPELFISANKYNL